MAVFDVILSNADRKGAHILTVPGGHHHGVDHGLTFHMEDKLRTVLWGWLGEKLTEEKRDGVGQDIDALEGGMVGGLRSCSVPRRSVPSPSVPPACSTTARAPGRIRPGACSYPGRVRWSV